MNDTELKINKGLIIVNKAKDHEKRGQYDKAAQKFKEAKIFFGEIDEIKLSAQCLAAHAVNIIKFYLSTRDIESFSDTLIDFYIKKINKIWHIKLNRLDKYEILIATYQELEGLFDKCYMKEQANKIYYEKTKLYSKYNWQIAISKEKGNGWYRTKAGVRSVFGRFFHWYCGYGERPLRALLSSIFFIIIFSLIFCCYGLIEYANPSVEQQTGWFQSFYFSIVTFTTLGFGDILPKPGIAQFIVAIEVLLGYVLLGTLVAILIRKITR